MAIIRQNSRILHHRLSETLKEFTVPLTEDFTDGSWVYTDLAMGELGINMTDDRIWMRTFNGLIELCTLGPSNSALWARDGSDIRAVNSTLDSPDFPPNILPADTYDCQTDLGSSTDRWRDLYLCHDLVIKPETGFTGAQSIRTAIADGPLAMVPGDRTVLHTINVADGEMLSIELRANLKISNSTVSPDETYFKTEKVFCGFFRDGGSVIQMDAESRDIKFNINGGVIAYATPSGIWEIQFDVNPSSVDIVLNFANLVGVPTGVNIYCSMDIEYNKINSEL